MMANQKFSSVGIELSLLGAASLRILNIGDSVPPIGCTRDIRFFLQIGLCRHQSHIEFMALDTEIGTIFAERDAIYFTIFHTLNYIAIISDLHNSE
jgi:hypothetical protein